MPVQYSNNECADISNSFSNENSWSGKRQYQQRFPNRILPYHKIFSLVFHNLQTNGSVQVVAYSVEQSADE